MDNDENIIYKKQVNWQPWIEKYGTPGLSTNVFDVDGVKYLLFHSYITNNGVTLKYYTGILRLNEYLNPIAYTVDCLFSSVDNFDTKILVEYFNWKRKMENYLTLVDVIFPMNVIVNKENITIYSGLNDCSAVSIKISVENFVSKIKNTAFILI